MEIFGTATINPVIFYSGKIVGYFTWFSLLLSAAGINYLPKNKIFYNDYIAFGLLVAGLIIAGLSLINLGKSTRFGLPGKKTILKTNGVYRFSRNPMYLGFGFITLASMIYFMTPVIILSWLYSIIVYHLIINGEEKFLEKTFGADYQEYKKKVRRYI